MTRAGQNPTATRPARREHERDKNQQRTRQEIAETNRTEYISEQGQIGTAENPESNSNRDMQALKRIEQNSFANETRMARLRFHKQTSNEPSEKMKRAGQNPTAK